MKDQSGLIYNRARYYDPSITRFIQIDINYDGESGSIASQNRYAYCLNNPYKYVDREGNSPFSMLGGGGKKSLIGSIASGVKTGSSKASNTIKQAPSKPVQKTAKTSNSKPATVMSSKTAQKSSSLTTRSSNSSPTSNNRKNTLVTTNASSNKSNKVVKTVDIKTSKAIECPKPKNINQEFITKFEPVKIRIRESVGYIETNCKSHKDIDYTNINLYGNSFYIDRSTTISAASIGLSLAGLKTTFIDIGNLTLDLLEKDYYENHYFGTLQLWLYWYVKRKEVDVWYPQTGYMRLFNLDQDIASGAILDMGYDNDFKPFVIAKKIIEDGDDPIVTRTYYENFNNNIIAKESVYYMWDVSSSFSLPRSSTYVMYMRDGQHRSLESSDFRFGPYYYYNINPT